MLLSILASMSLAAAPMVRVSVDGNGYFQFAEDGHALYTSSAPLIVDNGWLSYPNGAPLLPTLRVPDGTIHVEIRQDGEVFAATQSFKARVGRITLATFAPNADLRPYGSFLVSSALPSYTEPGDGAGTIHVLGANDPTPAPVAPPAVVATSETVKTDPAISPDDDFVQDWLDRKPEELPMRENAMPSGAAHITISSESDVNDDVYSLGDIAVIDADDTLRTALQSARIGDMPKPGAKSGVRRDAIMRELQSQGFDTSDFQIDIPRHAFVTRRGQKASRDAIMDAALGAASKIYANGDLKASLHIDSDYVPDGTVDYEVESCTPTRKGAVVIVVTKVDGARYNSHVVRISGN